MRKRKSKSESDLEGGNPAARKRAPKLSRDLKPKRKKVKGRRITKESVVLLVGEEGAVLVHMKRGKVVNRGFSPTATAPETELLGDIMRRSPRAPLYIVFDSVDQTYVQQTLPPVTALSINKLIKRRLERDFSADYIKGAVKLGREKSGRKDWLFMMVALQQNSNTKAWLEVATQWPNVCRGIFLLPVEASEILARLHNAILTDAATPTPPDWHILASYNKVSGIRQVIYNQGRLVLTRLGQPAVDASAETIAGTIEQEIISSKEYIKRLSYQDRDSLNIIIIASEEIRRNIDISKLRATRVDAITPYEASQLLDLEGAAQPTDRYGDSLLCAAFATNGKRVLTLNIDEFKRQQAFQLALYGIRGGMAVLVASQIFSLGSSAYKAYHVAGEIDALSQEQMSKQQQLEAMKKRAPRPLSELERIADVIDLYKVLSTQSFAPNEILNRFSAAIPDNVRTLSVDWSVKNSEKDAKSGGGGDSMGAPAGGQNKKTQTDRTGPQITSNLLVQFDPAMAGDRLRVQQAVTDTLNQLKAVLPQHDVEYTSQPGIISDSERIDVTLGQQIQAGVAPADPQASKLQARIAIAGPYNLGEKDAQKDKTAK